MYKNMLGRVGRFARAMDDKVQTFARDVYGANDPGLKDAGTFRGKVAAFGGFMHPRFGYQDKVYDLGVAMSRAAQLGGLTAAGLGLMRLTEQFGGAADQQEPGQLSLSEEEQETYNKIKVFQGAVIGGGAAGLGLKAAEMYRDRKRS